MTTTPLLLRGDWLTEKFKRTVRCRDRPPEQLVFEKSVPTLVDEEQLSLLLKERKAGTLLTPGEAEALRCMPRTQQLEAIRHPLEDEPEEDRPSWLRRLRSFTH